MTETEQQIKRLLGQQQATQGVTFVCYPLPCVRKVPRFVEEQLKKSRQARRRDETVTDYRFPVPRNLLSYVDYITCGRLQLVDTYIDDAGSGKVRSRLVGGKVREQDGELQVIATPERLPACRILNMELGRLGGDLMEAARKRRHADLMEKNAIDARLYQEFIDLIVDCKKAGWGVQIERS